MAQIFNSIIDAIGNTPIVKLQHCVPQGPHTFWAKIEYMNPGGSVKDRIAVSIISEAERRGDLKAGGTIIEATSGNTGLGLAMVAAVKGYKCIFVMPDKISEEKRAILRAYGAKVVITPTAVEPDDPRSFYSVAKKLVEITPNAFYANQYHNADNPTQHFNTTGPEIWEQTGGKIDVFVAGAGTGGTISGVGRYLKKQKPSVKIVCPDPVGSILYDLFYHKKVIDPPAAYKVEGVGEDMLPENVHMDVIDAFVKVEDRESFLLTRELVAKEALCVGPSSALALVGAIKFSKTLKEPSNILVMMADSGRSYLSKAFNDAWMRDNGFLPSILKAHTVADLLQKRQRSDKLISAQVGDSILQVATQMREHSISQVPVYSNGQVIGIIDESDLIEPIIKGSLKPTEPIIHLVKGTIIWVEMRDDLDRLNELFKEGYVALIKEANNVHIITRIDLLDFVGTTPQPS